MNPHPPTSPSTTTALSFPSLPLYRLTHVELSDCTVLSLIINTQDHQCSHLWAVSFGAIAIMVMFSENRSAERNELWRTAMMCWYLTQRLQSDLSWTGLMNRTRPLLSVLLYCFPYIIETMNLNRVSCYRGLLGLCLLVQCSKSVLVYVLTCSY